MLRKKFIKHEALLHYLTRLSFYLVMMFIIILQKSTGLVDFYPCIYAFKGELHIFMFQKRGSHNCGSSILEFDYANWFK